MCSVVGMNYQTRLHTKYHQAIQHPNLRPAYSLPKVHKSARNGTLALPLPSIKASPWMTSSAGMAQQDASSPAPKKTWHTRSTPARESSPLTPSCAADRATTSPKPLAKITSSRPWRVWHSDSKGASLAEAALKNPRSLDATRETIYRYSPLRPHIRLQFEQHKCRRRTTPHSRLSLLVARNVCEAAGASVATAGGARTATKSPQQEHRRLPRGLQTQLLQRRTPQLVLVLRLLLFLDRR